MTEYVFWALFALLGIGSGWLVWGRKALPELPDGLQRPTIVLDPAIAWTGSGPAPFRVVTLEGEVRYEGEEGGTARRHIEVLRSERIEWRAYRDGLAWDWGPRE